MSKLISFKALLDFGEKSMKMQHINISELRGVKKIFFPMLVATHNFAKGIYCLCNENCAPPCSVLLRSLCENLINARFLFCNRRKHIHVFYLDSILEKKKQLEHALKFLKKNPHLITETNVTIADVEKSLNKTITEEKKIKTKIEKFPGAVVLDALGRACYVDNYNIDKLNKSISLVWLYIVLFRNLSVSTHMKFLGFSKYFKKEESEIVVFLNGNPDDTEYAIALAEYFYKEFLRTFLKLFKSSLLTEFEKSYLNNNIS